MENISFSPNITTEKKLSEEEKENGWKGKIAERIQEYTKEDSKLGKMAQVAVNQFDKLKKSDKLKRVEWMADMGYKIKETKAEFLSGIYRDMAGATQDNKFLSTFFSKHSDIYSEEWDRARKTRLGEKKDLSRLSGMGQGVGTMLRYGRIAFDAGLANPFRHVMAASMFIGKQSEALKETRYEYEGAKENTRVNDVDRAMEEAWDIYDKAQAESKDGIVDAKVLEKAYKKNLPKDIEKRFARADYNRLNFIQKGMNRHLGWAMKRLADKIEKIENSDLSLGEKEQQKESLMDRNRKLLNDLDSMVGDNATVDTIAYLARGAEKTGKTVSTVMMIESIPRFAKLATKLGSSLWNNFGVNEAYASASSGGVKYDDYDKVATETSKYYIPLSEEEANAKENDIMRSVVKSTVVKSEETLSQSVRKDPVIESNSLAVIRKGDGVSDSVMRQLIGDKNPNHLKAMGYTGNINNEDAIKKWAQIQAGKIVSQEGYYNANVNKQTWVMKPGESAYKLIGDKKSGFSIAEYHDRNKDGKFSIRDLEIENKDSRDIDKPFEREHVINKVEEKTEIKTVLKNRNWAEDVRKMEQRVSDSYQDIEPKANLENPTEEMEKRYSEGLFRTVEQFKKEWPILKDMPAQKVINAKLGDNWWERHFQNNGENFKKYLREKQNGKEFIGRQFDQAEKYNYIELQKQALEIQKIIGEPNVDETIEEYFSRYEKMIKDSEKVFTDDKEYNEEYDKFLEKSKTVMEEYEKSVDKQTKTRSFNLEEKKVSHLNEHTFREEEKRQIISLSEKIGIDFNNNDRFMTTFNEMPDSIKESESKAEAYMTMFASDNEKDKNIGKAIKNFFGMKDVQWRYGKDGIIVIEDAYGKKGYNILLSHDKIGVDGPGMKNMEIGGWFREKVPTGDLTIENLKEAREFVVNDKDINKTDIEKTKQPRSVTTRTNGRVYKVKDRRGT